MVLTEHQSGGAAGSNGRRRRRDAPISHARLSEIIGSIYDCVLTPANWSGVLDTICVELSFVVSMLSVLRMDGSLNRIEAAYGFSPEAVARVRQYPNEVTDLWGGPERIMAFAVDEPVVFSQAVPAAVAETNAYVREWANPLGLKDQAVIILARDPTLVGNVAFGRGELIDPLAPEIDVLRLLAPHMRRAVAISNLFEMKSVEAATYASAFDAFSIAAVLVDENLQLVHANPRGKAILDEGSPFRFETGRLSLRHKAGQAMLAAAVADAARDVTALGQKGIAIPGRRHDGDACVIHVLPLRPTETLTGRQRAVAALFVTPSAQAPRMPTDALTLLYDLTPAEARVFELICDGETQGEIATKLGISRGTVKTHLLHVFEKTDCKRQADLVKLAAGLTLPV